MVYQRTWFYEEEFAGCCGIVILFEFPDEADKEMRQKFRAKVRELKAEWGGIVVALNNFQDKVWKKHLEERGFVCTSHGTMNPNTGNLLSTYFLDCKNEVREQEEDMNYYD